MNRYSYQLTVSIVLYNNEEQMLQSAIESVLLTTLKVHLFLVDNSETDGLKKLADIDSRITYIFNNANKGFGGGHNVAIAKAVATSKYHIILNPDVFFGEKVLEGLYDYMENHADVGIVNPKVFYPDGSLQYLCRQLPTPFNFFLKRVAPGFVANLFATRLNAYEFRNRNYDEEMDVPSLSGCFMFIRTEALQKAGGFDERYFMYMEDFDLSRRILKSYRTVYYPGVAIYHHYARESATNKKLLLVAIKSSIYYFNKWGWFIDKERKRINSITK